MSESAFPFGGVAVAPAVEPAPAPVDATPAGRTNRRRLLAFGGLTAVVVAAVAAYFLLLSGGTDATPSGATVVRAPRASSAPAAPAPRALPRAVDDTLGRDPFAPLYVAPAPKPSAAPATAPVGPAGTLPAAAVAPAPGGTAGAPAAGTTGTVKLADWISFTSQRGVRAATFSVHYTDNTVRTFRDVVAPPAGGATTFGGYFALLSLRQGSAVVQMGDATPMDLKVGAGNRQPLS